MWKSSTSPSSNHVTLFVVFFVMITRCHSFCVDHHHHHHATTNSGSVSGGGAVSSFGMSHSVGAAAADFFHHNQNHHHHHHNHHGSFPSLHLHPDQGSDLEAYANEFFKNFKCSTLESSSSSGTNTFETRSMGGGTRTDSRGGVGPLNWCRRVVFHNQNEQKPVRQMIRNNQDSSSKMP